MKKGLLLFWLLLTLSASFSQTISLSDDIPMRNDKYYYLIGELEKTYILIRDREVSRELVLFDHNLNNYQTLDLVLDHKRKTKIIDAFGYQGSMYIIYTKKEKNKVKIKVNKHDRRGSFQDSVLLATLDNQFISPSFSVERSPYGSKFCVYSLESEHELQLASFDLSSFSALYEDIFVFDDTRLRSELEKILLDEKGVASIITRNYTSINQEKRSTIDFFQVFPGEKESKFAQVYLGEINIISIHYELSDTGIELFGFSSKKANQSIEKYFSTQISQDLEIHKFTENTFSPSLLRSVYGRKAKTKKGIDGLVIKNLLQNTNGNKIYITEIERIFSRRPSIPTGSQRFGRGNWVDYYFEDLVLFCIDSMGNDLWQKVLHKKQFSQDDNGTYSSYFLMENPSSVRLIYNDEIKQENTVSEYLVAPDGYYERNSLFTTNYEKLQLRFQEAIQLSPNTFIVPSESSGRLNIVRVEF